MYPPDTARRKKAFADPVGKRKRKVPPAYSRADEIARSLYGRRDDDGLSVMAEGDVFFRAERAEAAAETAYRYGSREARSGSPGKNGRCNNVRDFGRGAALARFAVDSCGKTVVS